ncbi:PqqD family protein [Micrococcus sp. FDAARGOS_333]|uniref:PqqD family protein n=1 Tax=Micrococcus sp. FDAARGOS_333 TaxID=1930558 RepID=UPI000B4E27A6|nr:PqqD family protein [Micrococcus sp. FDAARGOS_333]PNL17477.1 PqqD family peptide modification chaperone [Micrococcus sp. FDAARGOS_333]
MLRLRAGLGHIDVDGLAPEEMEEVRRHWSRCDVRDHEPGAAAAQDGGHRSGAAEVPRLTRTSADWTAFHEQLVYDATKAAIASGRGTHVMLHAATLALPETKQALALAAASGTGKSTATRCLGRHLAYLTDETTIVDPQTRRITPYAKPLSLYGSSGVRPKHQHGPDELGLGPTLEDAELARIAVLDRVREGDEEVIARAEPMDIVTAVTALTPQSSSLSRLPRGLVALCALLDSQGGAVRLVYREAEDLLPVVQDLLSSPAAPVAPAWEALTEEELTASLPGTVGARARTEADDGVLTDDGRLLLLRGTELTVLSGLGAALWLHLDVARTPAELVERLAEETDVPDDAEQIVVQGLDDLTERGLLRR